MGTLVNQSADEGGGLPSPFLSWNTQINARCLEKTVVGGLPHSLCRKTYFNAYFGRLRHF